MGFFGSEPWHSDPKKWNHRGPVILVSEFFFEEHTDTRNTLYDLNDIANTNEIDIYSRSRIGPVKNKTTGPYLYWWPKSKIRVRGNNKIKAKLWWKPANGD